MKELTFPAVAAMQSPGKRLITFFVDGKLIPEFAAVARVEAGDAAELLGYQRPEMRSHISQIRKYLDETAAPMLPNSVVLAAVDSDACTFTALEGESTSGGFPGVLTIRYQEGMPETEKPCFIVDGQQRTAAIRTAAVDAFPMPVTLFFSVSQQEQAEQFILVNSPRPLPKGLIYRLLPSTDTTLPDALERRRLPALLLERLNADRSGPFGGAILTPTCPRGRIRDNSLLHMLEASCRRGALAGFGGDGESPDVEGMLEVVGRFWGAVAQTWPEAWALPPRQSRLTHGVGIRALGAVMDAMCGRLTAPRGKAPSLARFVKELEALVTVCAWTSGEWVLSEAVSRSWDDFQNTSQDIAALSNFLVSTYLEPPRKPAHAGKAKR